MIKAKAWSDDRVIECEFDATPWFEQATWDDVEDLRNNGFRGCYKADEVAIYCAQFNTKLADLFKYLELIASSRAHKDMSGFECCIDEGSYSEWAVLSE